MTDCLNTTKTKITNFLWEEPSRITTVSLERKLANQEDDKKWLPSGFLTIEKADRTYGK